MAFKLWPLNFVCVLAWIVGFGGMAKIPENVLFGAWFALIDEVLRGIVGFFSLFSISFVLVMN